MSTPIHRTASGSSYFVTTKCWQGRAVFQVAETAEIMANTLLGYRDSGAYLLHEFVIMPDHLYALLTPGRETTLEKAIQLIKGGSSHNIHKLRRNKMEIWQVGFYDWTIRDAADWRAKVNYIRMNPVRARLVQKPEKWAYSSASGRYALDGMPERYANLSSGAKAPCLQITTRGLKPPPPEEEEKPAADSMGLSTAIPQGLKPVVAQQLNVGPKGPTPGALTNASGAKAPCLQITTRGLKSLPPEEKTKVQFSASVALGQKPQPPKNEVKGTKA